MFRRRLFYDSDGKVIRSYMAQGMLDPTYTAEVESAQFGYQNYLEWNEPNETIESAFSPIDENGERRKVSVSIVQGVPVFEYFAIAVEPTETDMREALGILGVTV